MTPQKKHLLVVASDKENRIILKRFAADALNLSLTTATEEIKANTVLV
ncbi:MAG: hypothetical protein RLO19_01485 [Coleofasciculus sp. G2-EDA-02]